MNYIAHLHLAKHSGTSLVGNFLGDFVKGQAFLTLPFDWQQGIRLHRAVDSFTDSHPLLVQLKPLFSADVRRFAGIGLDIYFDHLLVTGSWQNWSEWQMLFAQFYRELGNAQLQDNPRFTRSRQGLIEHQWLDEYQYAEQCLHSFKAVERRFRSGVSFAYALYAQMRQHHEKIEATFAQFYPELMEFVEQQVQQDVYAK